MLSTQTSSIESRSFLVAICLLFKIKASIFYSLFLFFESLILLSSSSLAEGIGVREGLYSLPRLRVGRI